MTYQTEYIRRDSLMNFEIGATVEYLDSFHKVTEIKGNNITIRSIDLGLIETVHYTQLHVKKLPKTVLKDEIKPVQNLLTYDYHPNERKPYSQKDEHFFKQNIHLPNTNLSRLLGRSETAIAAKKGELKKQLTNK